MVRRIFLPGGAAAPLPHFRCPSMLHPLGRDLKVAPPRRGARLRKTLAFSIVVRFPYASRAGRPRPDWTSASLPLSMSAKRVSWFQCRHSSRSPAALLFPFCLLCKSVLQALRGSAAPREFCPPVRLPIPLRPWRTWRESFFRSPSAMARQDAAPPEAESMAGATIPKT